MTGVTHSRVLKTALPTVPSNTTVPLLWAVHAGVMGLALIVLNTARAVTMAWAPPAVAGKAAG